MATASVPPAGRTATEDLALERLFPGALRGWPRHPLTALPTPVVPLRGVAGARGLGELWMKRDDASSPLYGGNKPRKLEWLLGEAQRRGRSGVLTFGGIGTHHGLATAVCARDAGLRTVLVLIPQPVDEHVRRCLLLDWAYGAELHLATSIAGVALTGLALLARGVMRGEPLGIVPTGGTSALGAIGYVNAACELAEQVRAGEMPEPEAIFVPLGSGGTVAGLWLGAELAGLRSRIVAVLVTDILPPSQSRLRRLARAGWRRLRRARPDLPEVRLDPSRLVIERGWIGATYGAPTEAGVTAQRLLAEHEGVALETTYTAKCMAALLALAGRAPYRDGAVLFWNTYSSVDPGAALAELPDPQQLPPAFQRFFT